MWPPHRGPGGADVDACGGDAYKARMRTALIGLLLFVAASASAADKAAVATPASPAGHLQARQAVFDAGKIERGLKLRHTFVLRNVGKSALSIDAKPG